jgi:hypothetical protein
MAKNKKFDALDTSNIFNNAVQTAISETEPEQIPRQKRDVPPSAEIVEQAREQSKTQGRKGCKAHRFNMAFSPKAYEFITCMARVRGETITSFVNGLIEKTIDDNEETYRQALKFRDSL